MTLALTVALAALLVVRPLSLLFAVTGGSEAY